MSDKTENNNKKKVGGQKRRSKGEGSIRKKGNSYEGRVTITVNGETKQVSVSDKDKRILIQKMAQIRSDAENESYIPNNRITVQEWMVQWINVYKRGTIANRTLITYIGIINHYIIPEIGNYDLQKLQAIHVQNILTKMKLGECKTSKKCLSNKTRRDVYCVLNMALKEAVKNNIIKKNPLENIEIPRLKKKEPKIMTIEEQKEFEKLIENEYDLTIYLFIVKTGERASEVSGTKWEDIDFKKKCIYVREGYVTSAIYDNKLNKVCNTKEKSDLKSYTSRRAIPMLFGIEEIMLKYRKKYMELHNIKNIKELSGLPVFLTNKNNKVNADFLWTKLNRFLKRKNFRHIGVHELRHTFATRCMEAGVSAKYLQKLLGHSSTQMTDRYTHLLEKFEETENNKIQQYHNNMKEEQKTYKGKIKGKIRKIKKVA